eukprot:31224-Pelagococcus_subviridis.AAC.2
MNLTFVLTRGIALHQSHVYATDTFLPSANDKARVRAVSVGRREQRRKRVGRRRRRRRERRRRKRRRRRRRARAEGERVDRGGREARRGGAREDEGVVGAALTRRRRRRRRRRREAGACADFSTRTRMGNQYVNPNAQPFRENVTIRAWDFLVWKKCKSSIELCVL